MIMRACVRALSPGAAGGRLTILIFHRVLPFADPLFPLEPDVRRFATVMEHIRRWFQVLPLDQAARLLHSGNLPERAAAITFDDGYADNATQALPVLRHLGVRATFFIASGFLDGGRMWNDTVIEAVRRTRHAQLDLRAVGLGLHPLPTLQARRQAIDALLGQLKYRTPEQRQAGVAQVLEAADAVLPSNLMLRSEQLRRLRDQGMQIGAHTVSHPILESLSDAQAQWEIQHGKDTLENLLDLPVSLFAYPNGKPGTDFSARHVEMVRQAGFGAAVTTQRGAATPGSDLLLLPRYTPWERSTLRFGLQLLENLHRRA